MTTDIHAITVALAHLHLYARYLANAGILTESAKESLVDDACCAGVLGDVARRAVDAIGDEVAKAALGRLAEKAATMPTIEATADGFSQVLGLAGLALRWNTRAECVEVRHGDEGAWELVDDLQTDLIFDACSRIARIQRGNYIEPWGVRTARQERRLLNVVARRVQKDGEGSAVYQTVAAWATGRFNTRLTLNEVMTQAGVLMRFETGARAPVTVREDAKRALTDAHWIHKVSRRPEKAPSMLWVSPTGPPTRPRRVRVLAP